jgi:rod shape-determining protein MreC
MKWRRRDGRLVIALLIITSVVLLSLQLSGRYRGDLVSTAVLQVVSPCQNAFHWIISAGCDIVGDYIFLVGVKKENKRLRDELRRLEGKTRQLEEYEETVQRLRQLLLFKEEVKTKMIPAEVIAYSPLVAFRTVVVNKGERDGISNGVPALTWEGVVGRVIRTSTDSSVVLLILDRNSALDVLVQRTRTRALLEGTGSSLCRLPYIPRTEPLVAGDRIITSGLGGIFPKGLSVGKVIRVEKKEYGLFQDVDIEPCVDFSRLEEVMLVLSPDRQQVGWQ